MVAASLHLDPQVPGVVYLVVVVVVVVVVGVVVVVVVVVVLVVVDLACPDDPTEYPSVTESTPESPQPANSVVVFDLK